MPRITADWLTRYGFKRIKGAPGGLARWEIDLKPITSRGAVYLNTLVVTEEVDGSFWHPRILQTEGFGEVDTVRLPGRFLEECDRAAMEFLLNALGLVSVSDRG